ncbi:hypothetical protein GCM10023200_04400 [Actinomycetospora chlora]|uniref:NACHT domain-containing protein n=1 Tax=Actinomycetospora chlora TaxID=663608 RepID=A0ABP9A6B5_9PSEU
MDPIVSAAATSAAKAVSAMAVRASAPAWRSIARAEVFEPAKLKKLEMWPELKKYRKKEAKLKKFLDGRLCAGLLESYALVLSSDMTSPDNLDAMRETFVLEFADAMDIEDAAGPEAALKLWHILTDIVSLSLQELRSRSHISEMDLLFYLRFSNHRDYESPLRTTLTQRLYIASNRPRRENVRTLVSTIKSLSTKTYSEMAMPHARENVRVDIDSLYITRKLAQLPASWEKSGAQSLIPSDLEYLPESDIANVRRVVVGSPGAGKSTYARRLLNQLARSAEDDAVPLHFELKRWPEGGGNLVELLTRRLQNQLHVELESSATSDLLDLGIALVVFDGLDEVIDPNERRSVVDSIESFGRRYPLVPIIVTTRRQGYESAPLDPLMFPSFVISDFDDDQVSEYAKSWFSLAPIYHDQDATSIAESFIEESVHVAELRSNPLMLSLMCLLYQHEGFIPHNITEVYEQCAELLFGRWDRVRNVRSALRSSTGAHRLVEEIALHFFKQQRSQGGESARVVKTIVKQFLLRHLVDDEFEADAEAERFVSYCCGRAWLLSKVGNSGSGEVLLGFSHRTFMEYFAACHYARSARDAEDLSQIIMGLLRAGSTDVIPQLALARFDERSADGVDDCLRYLVFRSRTLTVQYDARGLAFALRTLKSRTVAPRTRRALFTATLRALHDEGLNYKNSTVLRDLPWEMRPELTKLASELVKTEPTEKAGKEAAAGAVLYLKAERLKQKDTRWVLRNAPELLPEMVLWGEIRIDLVWKIAGQSCLIDLSRHNAARKEVCLLGHGLRFIATSGGIMPSIESMLNLARRDPRAIAPMSPSGVEVICDALRLLRDDQVRDFFVSRPYAGQPVKGFQNVCAATALEAHRYGLSDSVDLAILKGFGMALNDASGVTVDELLAIIRESVEIELNDRWLAYISTIA